jgi:hypothetical protein
MWFRRTDGVMFSAAEENASFKLMQKSGEFEMVENPDESITQTQQPVMADKQAKSNSGSSGESVRSTAGKSGKAKNSNRT